VRGGHVRVELKDGKLVFDIDAAAPANPAVIEISAEKSDASEEGSAESVLVE
jgi:hypothetical protein